MKKSTLNTVYAVLSNKPVTDEDKAIALAEIEAEVNRNIEKAAANRELYEGMKTVVLAHLTDEPITVADLYAACEDELPEGASKSKIQYAIRELWANEVVKHENGKNPNTYTKA